MKGRTDGLIEIQQSKEALLLAFFGPAGYVGLPIQLASRVQTKAESQRHTSRTASAAIEAAGSDSGSDTGVGCLIESSAGTYSRTQLAFKAVPFTSTG